MTASGSPIQNAVIEVNGVASVRRTDANGFFYATVIPGTYNIVIKAPGLDEIRKVSGYLLLFSVLFLILIVWYVAFSNTMLQME